MNKRLQRILSFLCVLAMAMGCWSLSASAEQPNRVITVEWIDEDNYDGLRPASVEMSVGGTSVTLSAANGWTATAYAESGAEWVFASVPGYAVTATGTEIVKVTYRHPVSRTQLSAGVAWDDNGNAAQLRPSSVRIRLLADGKPFGSSMSANATNGWTVSWKDLPVNRKGSSEPIVYSIEQVDTLNAYTTLVSGAKVTNVLKTGTLSLAASLGELPEGADLSGMTVTVSGPDPKMPVTLSLAQATAGYSFGSVVPGAYLATINGGDGVAEGYATDPENTTRAGAVMVKAGQASTLSVRYGWRQPVANDDDEEVDIEAALAALEIEITGPDPRMPMIITYAEFVDGKYEIEGLVPGEYVVTERNPEGLIRTYVLTAESITGGTVTVTAEGVATVTLYNKYEPEPTPEPEDEEVEIPVTKIWDDFGNRDGNRPAAIVVHLYGDGVLKQTITLTAEMGWSYTFTGLPKYNEDGTEIVYTVSEEPVEWYTTTIEGTTIINHYKPETTTTTVSKIWDDNEDAQKIRPTSLAVKLLPTGTIYVLEAGTGWTLTLTDLPKFIDGKEVEYAWTEQVTVGYTLVSVKKDGDAYIFTNRVTEVPKVPEDQAQPKVPHDVWYDIEDYDTALGINILINHVGDCYD